MTTNTIEPGRMGRTAAGDCTPAQRVTRSLLGYGVVAGPFYVAASVGQGLIRDGFDFTRHDWSLLANGPGGWLQIATLVLTGVMVVAAAIGLRRTSSRTATWVSRLVAIYGLGMIGAGIFKADPMFGFPVGTPDGMPTQPTTAGTLHMIFGGVGFVCFVAACLVFARRMSRDGHRGRAWWSRGTAAGVLIGFMSAASGQAWATLVLTAGVILAWTWLANVSMWAYKIVTAPVAD